MLRCTRRCRANYMVHTRVVPDWWHPFYREDVLTAARSRLAAATEAGAAAPPPPDRDEDGASSPLHSSGGHGAASSQMTLYEANALVGTFTGMHHAEDLGAALQYIRGQLQQDLAPYHLHSLFRVFSHHQDRDSVLQLLDVMASRGETTLETYARALDFLHCAAPADVLPRALRVCALAQEAFRTHVYRPTAGSELATVAAYGTGPERLEAMADPHVMPGSANEEALDPACRAAPVLSALLHHTSCCTGTPLAPLLVAVWVRAIGVELSDWDYVCLLCCLLTQTECFPQVVQTVGLFAAFPAGSVSPAAVLARLRERGLCADADDPLAQLAAAMEASLQAEGVDLAAAVPVGVVNTQCTTLEQMVERVLQDAEARPGLGPFRFNTALLHHTLGIIYGARRDTGLAARQLLRTMEGRRRWAETYEAAAAGPAGEAAAASVGEPYHVPFQQVLDVGSLLPALSSRRQAQLRAPYLQLVKEIEVEASEERLRASTALLQGGAALTTVTTLQAPPRVPSVVDALACATYSTNLLQTNEEARAALQRAIGLIDPAARRRLPRTTRQLFRQFAEFCSRHPLPNCKMTSVGLQERARWGRYLEARDTALALFGSAQQARDAMKALYLHQNQLHELRSPAVLAQDSADAAAIFFPALKPGWDPARLQQERTTLPHLRCPSDAVPRHLWDPAVYNPYPHVMLKRSPQETDPITEDLFLELWRVLMDPAIMGQDVWFLQNTDMYLVLMRCLLHRLDWEAAVHLTTKMLEHSTYTFMVDHELTRIFQEIGDPAGCLAFKVATRLFDGRITRDGQTKREQFHQDQFN